MNFKETGAFANFGAGTYRIRPKPRKVVGRLHTPWPVSAAAHVAAHGGRAVVFGDFSDMTHGDGVCLHTASGVDVTGLPNIRMFDNWTGLADQAVNDARSIQGWVVASSYLAGMVDPRPLLRALKGLCLRQALQVLFVYDVADGVYRTWTERQFTQFLKASGFELTGSTGGRSGEVAYLGTITPASYRAYLQQQGLAPELLDADLLLVSTEDATVRATGGIGTYVKNIKALDKRAVVLMCDIDLSPSGMDGRTLVPRMFGDALSRESFFDGLGLIETCRAVLYLLPNIQIVESQDYKSIAFRLVQSKRTGGLPQWLNLRVFMHGSIDYMKYGVQDESAMDYTPYELAQAVRDSYIFEFADECYAPSRYLGVQLLQQEFGYKLNNLSIRRLPFDLSAVPADVDEPLASAKRIVFIGKYSRLKGWPDFVAAMEGLYEQGALDGVEEIVSLGPMGPGNDDRARLEKVRPYRDHHLSHSELLEFVARNRADSMFVVPSRGENYPFVILEQMLIGTRLVAYNTGGAIEVVDDPGFVDTFFSAPNAKALQQKIAEVLALDANACDQRLLASRQRILDRQVQVNMGWSREETTATHERAIELPEIERCAVTIVIPVYNTSIPLISELLESVVGSRVRPTEVILIDDGSEKSYRPHLHDCVEKVLGDTIAWRVHTQENKGLAGARNAGLALSQTPFTFFIDSDDLLLPSTLEEAWTALHLDPMLVVATGFAVHFSDSASLPATPEPAREGWFWKSLGVPQARALALLENQYLTANVMARTALLRECGGWDEQDKSTWEDWAFFSKLAWEGRRFSLIPSLGYLYRNTPGSMSKTYNRYFGRRRLIRNIAGVNKLDANALFSLINVDNGGGAQLNGASLSEKEVELINLIRSLIQKPRLRRLFIATYRVYTKARRMFR